MITIIDYGMGNLGSVQNMLKKIGEETIISSDKAEIAKASKLLLPGVGAFDVAVENLKKLNLFEIIKEKVLIEKTPILGICLGMHLLTKNSEEGILDGFGFVDASVKRFNFQNTEKVLPIPHMGWNQLIILKESNLLDNEKRRRYYFVHSYAVICANEEDIVAQTNYGYKFVSIFEKENILGCQFHPEKSHKFGMQLLTKFVKEY